MDLDDDDDFDDADLDLLPSATFHELERRALGATQPPPPPRPPQHALPADLERPRSSDYGIEDEWVVDLNAHSTQASVAANPANPANAVVAGNPIPSPARAEPDEVTRREQWRLQRYGAPSAPARPPAALPDRRLPPPQAGNAVTQEPDNVTSLQARIAHLEHVQQTLLRDKEAATAEALKRSGEIAIVRSNHDRAIRDNESKIADLKQKHADELARQRAELDAAVRDREKMETDNKFLRHDLQQEAERARSARRTQTAMVQDAVQPTKRASPLSTPSKRQRHMPYRDGFDDDEIMAMSPQRPRDRDRDRDRDRSKPGTPTGGPKRKRADTAQSVSDVDRDAGTPSSAHAASSTTAVVDRGNERNEQFDFSQLILDHRTRSGQRILEAFSSVYFKSDSAVSLASLLYDSLRAPRPEPTIERYRVQVCEAVLTIWTRCLDEKVYAPLRDVLDLIMSILMDSPESLSVEMTRRTVPLCRSTAELLAVPRFEVAKTPDAEVKVADDMLQHIRPYDVLSLLQIIAAQCELDHATSMTHFWTAMDQDFVLVMLARGQPLTHMMLMLDLLGTSVLRDSFGVIARPKKGTAGDAAALAQQQLDNEQNLLSRLTVLLVGVAPKPPPIRDADDEALERTRPTPGEYDAPSIQALRTRVLALFQQLCATAHGGRALASHRHVVGRLARFLHESVAALYACAPRTHAATSAHVNAAVLILASLTALHPDALDLRARLAVEPGGCHKHLVGLSRVAFAEGATEIEAGIWPEARDAAHRMLDEMLTPEEGDAVVSVFSSGR